jgi:hypothetical protein
MYGNDYHLVQDIDDEAPRRRCWRIRECPLSTLRNIDGGSAGRSFQRIRECPPSML